MSDIQAADREPNFSPEVSAEAPPQRSRFAMAFRALQHRNYQLFASGQLISLIGTWMQTIAESWLVYRLTGSSLLLGTVAFVGRIPIFLLAPIGGIVADRWNRHRVVIATQTASMILAFTLAALTLTNVVKVWEVMTLAALLGIVNAFDIPTRQAFIMDMVGREDLMNGIALNSSMFNGARVLGPAIAGILVASIGEGWCFFANAVSYIAVITGLLLMKLPPQVPEKSDASPVQHLLEGFRFVMNTTPIRSLLILLGITSFMSMPYVVLMPIFADRILHGGARALGILMGANGVGAVIGALTLAMRPGIRGLGRLVAISSGFLGIFLMLFAASRFYWLSVVLLVPAGYTMMRQMASSNTLIQTMSPDRLRGRILSAYSMMFVGMAPIGALVAGAAADRLGAPLTVGIGGAGCVLGSAFFWYQLPKFREEARKLIAAQGMVAIPSAEPAASPND